MGWVASVKFCLSAGGADSHSVGRASGEESTLPGKTEIHHPIFESRNLNLAGEFDSQFALFSSYLSLFHPTLVWSPVLTKVNNNAASPSYHNMHSDEGAQSSEEGSALRSPAFAPAFSPIHGDNCQLSSHLLRHLSFIHLHIKSDISHKAPLTFSVPQQAYCNRTTIPSLSMRDHHLFSMIQKNSRIPQSRSHRIISGR